MGKASKKPRRHRQANENRHEPGAAPGGSDKREQGPKWIVVLLWVTLAVQVLGGMIVLTIGASE
ncbi:MAG: hypothetical protein ACREI3_05600 [Nitrospirales bacterium]